MDQAILYIQQEYAGDPRQFFFGQKRYQSAMISSTFDYRSFNGGNLSKRAMPKDLSPIRGNEARLYLRSSLNSVRGAEAPAAAESLALGDVAMKQKEPNAPEPTVRSDFRS